MTRFFIRPDQIVGDQVTLEREDAMHLDRVLRAKIGDEIGVLDGTGRLAIARLTALSKAQASASLIRVEKIFTEPKVPVIVAQAFPKTGEKLEWVLQHGVEVGAAGFIMFRSARSEAGKLADKTDRWRKIVKTAAEQSGRAVLPDVEAVADLVTVLDLAPDGTTMLFCDEAEQSRTLHSAIAKQPPARVLLIIGPEGGWSELERKSAASRGALPITLGPRTLRTETAALVALSQVFCALDAG
jgi:16S rRNA (uracil1498-N3)-methyltransferase